MRDFSHIDSSLLTFTGNRSKQRSPYLPEPPLFKYSIIANCIASACGH